MGEDTPECRICLGGADEGELLSGICACRGTQGHVHVRCLAEWQAARAATGELWQLWRCSVCRTVIDPRARRGTLGRALPLLLRGLGSQDWWPALAAAVLAAVVAVVLEHFTPRHLVRLTPVWAGAAPHEHAPLTAAGEASWRGVWWGAFHESSSGPVDAPGASLALWNSSLLLYGGLDNQQGPHTERMWTAPLDELLRLQRAPWAPLPLRHQGSAGEPGRHGQTLTRIGPDRFLVFGGHNGYTDPGGWSLTGAWLVLSVASGAAEVQSGGVAPLALAHHSATFVPAGPGARARHFPRGYVLVFGGTSAEGPSGRVLLFDLDADRWALDPELVEGRAPPKRSGHSATAVPESEVVWVVGGIDDRHDLDDGIWPFDTAQLRWLPALPHPSGLAAGGGHTAVATRGHMLFFGGGQRGSHDLLALRVEDRSVRCLSLFQLRALMNVTITGTFDKVPVPVTIKPIAPPALRSHAAVWTGEEMLVYGGVPSEASHLPLPGSSSPSPRAFGGVLTARVLSEGLPA